MLILNELIKLLPQTPNDTWGWRVEWGSPSIDENAHVFKLSKKTKELASIPHAAMIG